MSDLTCPYCARQHDSRDVAQCRVYLVERCQAMEERLAAMTRERDGLMQSPLARLCKIVQAERDAALESALRMGNQADAAERQRAGWEASCHRLHEQIGAAQLAQWKAEERATDIYVTVVRRGKLLERGMRLLSSEYITAELNDIVDWVRDTQKEIGGGG